MHTVELLDQALAAALKCGYRLRQDWLGGSDGGGCEIKGQKWIFLDLSLSPSEQLDVVVGALEGDPALYTLALSSELGQLLGIRKSA